MSLTIICRHETVREFDSPESLKECWPEVYGEYEKDPSLKLVSIKLHVLVDLLNQGKYRFEVTPDGGYHYRGCSFRYATEVGGYQIRRVHANQLPEQAVGFNLLKRDARSIVGMVQLIDTILDGNSITFIKND